MKDIECSNVCEVVQDLLPLYYDGVCSAGSRALVEGHLKDCDVCGGILKALGEQEGEKKFALEAQDVLSRHAKKEMTAAVRTGIILAGLLMLPVIVAVLLTLPGYSDWKTNAVLISAMLFVAGLTVVPLVSRERRFTKSVVFSLAALLCVIFFTEMFFDDGGLLRFCEIAFSTVFGASLFLFPFVVRQAKLPDMFRTHKGLLTMSWDTLWFYLMILTFATEFPESFGDLLAASSYFVLLAWLLFFGVRYLKVNGWIKAGGIVVLLGLWMSVGNLFGLVTIMDLDLHVEILVASLFLGGVLSLPGVARYVRGKRDASDKK